MDVRKIKFQQHGDDRGMLVALEENKEIPFKIKRIYYLFDTLSDVRRGFHAHKNLKQILICVSGSCKIHLDNGFEIGIFIDNNIWREMYDFSDNAVLLVLASELYDESDYIRNYNEFKKFIGKEGDK